MIRPIVVSVTDSKTAKRIRKDSPTEGERCPECGSANKTTIDAVNNLFSCRSCGMEWSKSPV